MSLSLDLAGSWDFALGEKPDFKHRINLPGSLQNQGFGNDVSMDTPWTGLIVDRSWFIDDRYAHYRKPDHLKIPFWLQPDKHYIGKAWFRRKIKIPLQWTNKRITLVLERAHIQTRVFLDGKEMGSCNRLATPHRYDLGCHVTAGEHELSIEVDNHLSPDVGHNASSVSDHSQTNWNGIIGKMQLRATPLVWLDNIQIFPNLSQKNARLQITIGNTSGQSGKDVILVDNQSYEIAWEIEGGVIDIMIPLEEKMELWDEFQPTLHTLVIRFGEEEHKVTFGLREISLKEDRWFLNGRPLFLRGTLECCVFPHTGYPSLDQETWNHILGTVKSYGFNHVRFHSWCPPEAAFLAADALGLYLQIECSAWPNSPTTGLGMNLPIDDWLYQEAEAIIRAYGNHPSFLLMALGNEPGTSADKYTPYLKRWVHHWKQKDPRRFHTSTGGWLALPENDYHNIPEPRIQHWNEGLKSRINSQPPATTADYCRHTDPSQRMTIEEFQRTFSDGNRAAITSPRPIVSHEVGQWCAYPDFSEIPKYTGLLKARNFEIFKESLESHHMGDQANDFLQASGKLQILCYKEDIESLLRTRGLGGFQILQANDFQGQGTALVGWLNAFWESKGYVTPKEFCRFHSPTVILARMPQLVYTQKDIFEADLEIAHFGPAPLKNARPYWKLIDTCGSVHVHGKCPTRDIPLGNGISLGHIRVPLEGLPTPEAYSLVAGLEETDFENDWNIWIYPQEEALPLPEEICMVRSEDALWEKSRRFKKLLYVPDLPQRKDEVALGFSSIFWNTA